MDPLRPFASLDSANQARIKRNIAKMQGQNAPDSDLETYLRDVEHLAPSDQGAPTPPPVGHVAGIAGSLNRALPFASDIEGAVGALTDPTSYHGHFQENFTKAREASQSQHAQYQEEHPITSTLATTAGAAATMLAKPLTAPAEGAEALPAVATGVRAALGRLGKSAATGAAAGTVYGLGDSRGSDIASRLQGGITGAKEGAVLGTVLHPISAVTARIAAKGSPDVVQATGQPNKAANAVRRVLETEAPGANTAEGLATRAAQGTTLSGPKPEIAADYSPGLRGMVADVTRTQTPEAAALRAQLQSRNQTAPARIGQDLTTAFGENTKPAEPIHEQLVNAGATLGKQLFGAANRMKVDFASDPVIQAARQKPVIQRLEQRAMAQAANEGRQLPQSEQPTEQFAEPEVQAYVNAQRPEKRADVIAFFKKAGKPMLTTATTGLDTKALHYMMQGANDMVASGFDDRNTKLLPDDAETLKALMDGVKERVKQLNPKFRTAMDQYAKVMDLTTASKLGLNIRQFGTLQGPEGSVPPFAMGENTPKSIADVRTGLRGLESGAFPRMTPVQQSIARQGAHTAFQKELQAIPATPDAANVALAKHPNSPEGGRLRSLLAPGSPIESALERERGMTATGNVVPDFGTRPDLSPTEAGAQAIQGTHVPSIKYATARGTLGALQSLIRPKPGPVAALLSRSPEGLSAAFQSQARGRQELGMLQRLLLQAGVIGALDQTQR